MYKVYTKNNYFIVESDSEFFHAHKKNVTVDKNNVRQNIFTFKNIRNWNSHTLVNLQDVRKEDGSTYTEQEFFDFYTAETGNFKSGEAIPQTLEDLINPQINSFLRENNLSQVDLALFLNTSSDPFAQVSDLASISIGTNIFYALTYDSLPSASLNSGRFYYVEQNQGTAWLPGNLGGTYYSKGLYYSNGVTWITTDSPINANQNEVNAGLNDNKFVTAKTLKDTTLWQAKTSYTHNQNVASNEWVITHNLNFRPNVVTFDSAGTEIKGDISHITDNQIIITYSSITGGIAYLS